MEEEETWTDEEWEEFQKELSKIKPITT